MKKTCKKITTIFIAILMISSIFTSVNASDIWQTGKDFLQTGADTPGMQAEDKAILELLGVNTKVRFEELIDFLWGIGLLAVFISTIVLGIKYMLVSPAEKSKIKQSTTPYLIGVIIIFGALTIWKFIIVVLDGSL